MTVTTLGKAEMRRKALQELDRVKQELFEIIEKDFHGYPRLRSYVIDRVRRARDILMHLDTRLRSIENHGVEGYRVVFLSSEFLEHGAERRVLVRKLTGGITVVEYGTPLERSIHIVEVSRWRHKCSCPDAIFTSARADSAIMKLDQKVEPLFYKYVLCKHTLAALALLSAIEAINLGDRVLRETLWLALLAALLRVVDTAILDEFKEVIDRGIGIATKRMRRGRGQGK